MSISWFPGHMAKTRRMISENLKLVDIVIELADARIPQSSRNPILSELLSGKPSILVLNKVDLADSCVSEEWRKYFNKFEKATILCDCESGRGVERLVPAIREILKEKIERFSEKGMGGRPLKAMVVGIPNVGKSSLINRLSKRKSLKTEDRPGVTRDKSWTRLESGIELMDMPGILWPKFEDPETANHLAYTGAVKDEVMDLEEVASGLLKCLAFRYPEMLISRYNITKEDLSAELGFEILEAIGRKRGFLIRGGEIDTLRASKIILDEFRGGKIGNISLEIPPKKEK